MRLLFCLVVLISMATPVGAAKVRTWTSTNGGFEIEAALVDMATEKNGDVILTLLRKKDGIKLRVPLAMLGRADQRYVAKFVASDGKEKIEIKKNARPFNPGDGEDMAREFLAAENLVEEKGIWSLAGESEVADNFDAVDRAFKNFTMARGQVAKNQRRASKLDAKEKTMIQQIGSLEREIARDKGRKSTFKRRAKLEKLKQTLENDFVPAREKFREARREVKSLREECREILDKLEEPFLELDESYESLAKNKSALNALEELGEEMIPSDNFSKQKKKISKIRTGLRTR